MCTKAQRGFLTDDSSPPVTYFVISYRPFVLIGRTKSLSNLNTASVIVLVDQQHLTALLMLVE